MVSALERTRELLIFIGRRADLCSMIAPRSSKTVGAPRRQGSSHRSWEMVLLAHSTHGTWNMQGDTAYGRQGARA